MAFGVLKPQGLLTDDAAPFQGKRMDTFFERLLLRAATIGELLSDDFETLPGQKAHSDLATQRLSAWCQSCASGDWSMFGRRLEFDGLSLAHVLERFATVRRKTAAGLPIWTRDAIWILEALQSPFSDDTEEADHQAEPYPFETLFRPVVKEAETLLWVDAVATTHARLNQSAHTCLRQTLLKALSNHCAPAIYERFANARKAAPAPAPSANNGGPRQNTGSSIYDGFVAELRGGGFRRLFEDKPVLLRTIAVIVRQWIDRSREFIARLDADWKAIEQDLLSKGIAPKVDRIEGDLSDPHNGGRSVQLVRFADGAQVLYKPKDQRLDAAWRELVARLNSSGAPIALRAPRVIVRDGYGWAEFIEHRGCADQDQVTVFFQRAGAWLALFHCFAAADMHEENLIACGDHPVPIDMEMVLQALPEEHRSEDSEAQAFEAARELIGNSIMMVGLLPTFGRSQNNDVFAVGGMNANWQSQTEALSWINPNTDTMRPVKSIGAENSPLHIPHLNNNYVKFSDHIDDFIVGFEKYTHFILEKMKGSGDNFLFDGFAGLPVRKVIRPTRFYAMLAERLKDHRKMTDGVIWSAQADFLARLTNWEKSSDPFWPLQRSERSDLLALNVPYFMSPSDGQEIRDAGISIPTQTVSGLERARSRVGSLNEQGIAWQIEICRQNTISTLGSDGRPTINRTIKPLLRAEHSVAPSKDTFIAEAGRIALEISSYAIRRDSSAAWIGLDWMGDSEVAQLVPLGLDLYNGAPGIAVFLAAHAASTRCTSSAELALAATSHVRKTMRSRNAARLARALGLGGATGLGSIVYALTVMGKFLGDDDLLADALVTANLFTDDLIAADRQFDLTGGCAGAILALLRLYRDTQSREALRRATECGEHLLRQNRPGSAGRRTWARQDVGGIPLAGMSHGAAGFAYALSSLAAATERDDFAKASAECIAFENSSFNPERCNWPRLHADGDATWPCQWCHGATGIGLARIAMIRQGTLGSGVGILTADVENAVRCANQQWPGSVDTLCCGTLGNIEFIHEAGYVLGHDDLRDLAAQRLMAVLENATLTGQYRWDVSKNKFNLGLFRGLAGVGYTLLRQTDGSLPNILVWE